MIEVIVTGPVGSGKGKILFEISKLLSSTFKVSDIKQKSLQPYEDSVYYIELSDKCPDYSKKTGL